MLYVHPFKFSNIFLLFLMFSLIFIDMQIRSFVYHTIGLKCNVSTFICYQVWLTRKVSTLHLGNIVHNLLIFFYHFSLISHVFINIHDYSN